MGFSVIFIAISCFAVLQAEAVGDSKGESRHSTVQITRSTIRDNLALKKMQENLRDAHNSLKSNQIAGSATHDQVQIQPKYHSQDIQTSTLSDQGSSQNQFLSQSTTRDSFPSTTTSSVGSGNIYMNGELPHQKQQLNRQGQGHSNSRERFNSNDQSVNHQGIFDNNQHSSEDQQFYNSREQSPAERQQLFSRSQQSQQPIFPDRQSSSPEQQFYNMRQQAQQQQFKDPRNQQEELFNPRQQSNSQQQHFNAGQQSFEQPQEFNNDGQQSNVQQQLFNAGQQSFEQHQKFNNAGQQSFEQQQQLFNAGQQQRMYNNMDIDGQIINNRYQGLSIHQSQVRSERPVILSQNILTQMHSKGVRKDAQLSAYDNREHGLVLPRGTSVQSSSVVVSGLKNLPMLPAMVYNAGPVPATHAIAYGRDGLYKGSAHLNLQMRTPYVRYVYSHIL